MDERAISQQQNAIRQDIIRQRRSLSHNDIQRRSLQIAQQVQQLDEFQNAETLALYLSVRGEVDTQALIDIAHANKKRVVVPKVQDTKLCFYRYDEDALQKGRFGILEPSSTEAFELSDIDIILMPLVAFDNNGHRIGMGGGYYDTTLAAYQNAHTPFRLGLGYAFQHKPLIQHHEWDINLHAIATENKIHRIKKR